MAPPVLEVETRRRLDRSWRQRSLCGSYPVHKPRGTSPRTAGGDPKKTQAAGQTITFAVFGLVAVIAAWFILLFIEKFTGVNVTELDLFNQ